jgi:hypothetical protein
MEANRDYCDPIPKDLFDKNNAISKSEIRQKLEIFQHGYAGFIITLVIRQMVAIR